MQGKKAIIIFVPVPQLKAYQKIQTRLVRELEKKFNGKPVVFIAQVCHLSCVFFFFLIKSVEVMKRQALFSSGPSVFIVLEHPR